MLKALVVLLLPALLRAQPQVLSFTPPVGAVDVPCSAPLEILFDRPVVAGPGHVQIWNQVEEIVADIPAAGLDYVGTHVTIALPAPLPWGNSCLVTLYDCFQDTQGHPYEAGYEGWTFTVEAFEILEFVPAQFAQGVDVDGNLGMRFNRPISAGPGTVEIRRAYDDISLYHSFAAADLAISGAQVTIDPPLPLEYGTTYYLTVSPDAFHDGAGAFFPGFSEVEAWMFTTETLALLAVSPADDALDVAADATLELTFNGDVQAGPGALFLRRSADNSLVQSVPASQLTISGNRVIFQPADFMDFATGYYVEIDADAFLPVAGGGAYEGLGGAATWSFTTIARFSEVSAGLPGSGLPSAAWGDYDNDGDLDLLLSGQTAYDTGFTRLYRNDGGQFTDAGVGAFAAIWGVVAWGDLESDGDLDILLSGRFPYATRAARVFRNDGSAFTEMALTVPPYGIGPAGWGDFDQDGDLDILQGGDDDSDALLSTLLRNDGGSFFDLHSNLLDFLWGTVTWADADNDGDLDLLLSGFHYYNAMGFYATRLYRNNAGLFSGSIPLTPMDTFGPAAWGDYDNDHDLDLLLASDFRTRVYRNSGSFSDAGAGLIGLNGAAVAWGDLDNDGRLDLLACGDDSNYNHCTRIYRNLAGGFSVLTDLAGVVNGAVAEGDVDNDGDLDLLVCGSVTGYSGTAHFYRNNSAHANTAPLPPSAPQLSWTGSALSLVWNASSDAETPAAGLGYNVEVGMAGATLPLLSGLADEATGLRRLPALGNAGQAISRTVAVPFLAEPPLPQETRVVVGGVQAIDHAWAGSVFAWDTLALTTSTEFLALHNPARMQAEDLLSWDLRHTQELAGFELQLAATPDFSPLLGQTWLDAQAPARDLLVCTPLASLEGFDLLEGNHLYYWRLRPVYLDARRVSVFSASPGVFTYVATPPAPQHLCITATGTTATLSWDPVPGNLVYYVVYSSTEAYAPFPAGWQAQTPTFQTTWTDPQPTAARMFYQVKAVLLE